MNVIVVVKVKIRTNRLIDSDGKQSWREDIGLIVLLLLIPCWIYVFLQI